MKRILLPLIETDRSLKALRFVRKNFAPEEADIILMMVDDSMQYTVRSEADAALKAVDEKLEPIKESLEDYKVTIKSDLGKPGARIVRAARELGADYIVMTKSSRPDMLSFIGSTTEYVIHNAPCDVIIVSESNENRNEYRGLVYRTAAALVTLRGQLGDKQSECLLPSVRVDCNYHFDVTVGKIRFMHTAYNPETRNWDLPPMEGQEVTRDILAGESADILVKADSTDGKADRIRIINRDMKKEAVFSYRITAAPSGDE